MQPAERRLEIGDPKVVGFRSEHNGGPLWVLTEPRVVLARFRLHDQDSRVVATLRKHASRDGGGREERRRILEQPEAKKVARQSRVGNARRVGDEPHREGGAQEPRRSSDSWECRPANAVRERAVDVEADDGDGASQGSARHGYRRNRATMAFISCTRRKRAAAA